MIMNTTTNRILEHLNIFSIDYYKKQQQQYDDTKMNMTSTQHDKTVQSSVKDEKKDYDVDNHLIPSPSSTDNIDQPLLIVLDEDDENDTTELNSTDDLFSNEQQNTINSIENSPTAKQSENKLATFLKPTSTPTNLSKLFRRSRKTCLPPSLNGSSNKFIRTVVIDSSFMRQTQHRNKLIARRKNLHTFHSSLNMTNNSKNLSMDDNSNGLSLSDSILSNISFDNTSDILTVSRMGSIFYCLEDLYTKVFSSLCTFDEFTNLLLKPEKILVKQVTLSEKMSIEQKIPSLKKFTDIRYRLISINSSDYLLKLKQLLLINNNIDEKEKQEGEKRIDQIIDEMHSYKRTPTPVLLKDKVSHSPMTTKRLSSDDDDDDDEHDEEPRKRLKIVTKKQKSNETPPLAPTQFGIFIQCNGPVSCNIFSTNETVSSSTTATTSSDTTTTVAKTDTEIITKSTFIKKSNENENSQIYFDKFQQQYQTIPKYNSNNQKPATLNRSESHSPTDCTQIHKTCSSSTVMNMPIKRRILNSYNSDTSDSSGATTVHISLPSTNHSRYLHRSKSLTYTNHPNKKLSHRSSSLPSIIFHLTGYPKTKKCFPVEMNPKLNLKSKTEPIDLTDETYSMPMIVNVEENVELANQRHKIKSKRSNFSMKQKSSPISISESELRTPSTINSRPTSHDSHPPAITKPPSFHHPVPSSFYRTTPYAVYHQESYTYRDPSPSVPPSSPSISHPYPPNNGNIYPYPFSSSTPYQATKKSKELPILNCYSTRPNSVAPTHSSSTSNNNNNSSISSVVMPIVRKPNYYHTLTPEQQASIKIQTSPPISTPCRLPCCYPPPMMQQHATDKPVPNNNCANERIIYRQYTVPSTPVQTFKRDPSQTPDIPNSSPSLNRKQRRMDSVPTPSSTPYPPYSSTKSYFVPPPPPSSSSASHWSSVPSSTPNPNMKPSIRYPYPPPSSNPSMNGIPRKIESYPQPRRPTPIQSRSTTTPVVVQNSSTLISPPNTPHELTLPNIRTRSIDLQRAIVERGYCDMDKLPKLVVRHTKTYSNKTIDTMGQLFPTWFNEPDYRCINCFRCDQVFTPQQFMTHVDDEHLQNEQPLSMTSIQLLTSEKMSEYKVGLWNQFCTNLTIYAREGRIGGFSTNRNV